MISTLSILSVMLFTNIESKKAVSDQTAVEGDPPCLQSYECALRTIEEGNPQCYGFQSCYQSRITSSDSLECTGGESCKEPKNLEAALTVTCSGIESCMKSGRGEIKSLNGSVQCLSHTSCSQSAIRATEREIICSASQSCKSTDMSCKSVMCYGFKSCHLAWHLDATDQYACDGPSSCVGATAHVQTLEARADNAASKANLYVYDTLNAYGLKSVYNAKVSAKTLDAFGWESAKEINIDTQTVNEMTINLFGYEAGEKGKVTCRSGHSCSVNCKGNGCYGFTLFCEHGSQCMMDPAPCHHYASAVESVYYDFVACPIFVEVRNDQDLDTVIAQHGKLNIAALPKLYDRPDYEPEEDVEEDDDTLSTNIYHYAGCDEVEECKQRHFTPTDADAICLGYMSCREAVFNFDDDIQCHGYQSCMDSTHIVTDGTREVNSGLGHGTGKGFVKCWSTESCYKAGIIRAAEVITCYGQKSCAEVGEIESTDQSIKCEGGRSCQYSPLKAYKKVICSSYESCHGSTIDAFSASCGGYDSCKGSTVTVNAKMSCTGPRSCVDSVISAKIYEAHGYFDSVDSVIQASTVSSYGFGGLAYSQISPTLRFNKIRVFAYGHRAGLGAVLTCQSGQNCKLYCHGDGCLEMEFNCYLGSKCFVFPKGCPFSADEQNLESDATVNGTNCPIWMYQKEPRQSTQFEAYVNRLRSHQNDEMYQKVMGETMKFVEDTKDAPKHKEELSAFVGIESVSSSQSVHSVDYTVLICGVMVMVSAFAVIAKFCLVDNTARSTSWCSVSTDYQQIV